MVGSRREPSAFAGNERFGVRVAQFRQNIVRVGLQQFRDRADEIQGRAFRRQGFRAVPFDLIGFRHNSAYALSAPGTSLSGAAGVQNCPSITYPPARIKGPGRFSSRILDNNFRKFGPRLRCDK